MSTRFQVKHKLTGKLFTMQMVDESIPRACKEVAKLQSKSLVFCTRERLPTIAVIDQFMSYNKSYFIYEKPTKKSLRNGIEDMNKTCLTEAQTKIIIHHVLKAVNTLHKNNIKHGNLNIDNILAKTSKKGWEIQLSGFEFSKMKQMEKVEMNAKSKSNSISENIEKEKLLKLSDDVLDIGYMAFQMLSDINMQLDT